MVIGLWKPVIVPDPPSGEIGNYIFFRWWPLPFGSRCRADEVQSQRLNCQGKSGKRRNGATAEPEGPVSTRLPNRPRRPGGNFPGFPWIHYTASLAIYDDPLNAMSSAALKCSFNAAELNGKIRNSANPGQ